MKAASDGWRISYIGGNRFEFYNTIYNKGIDLNTDQFLNEYVYDFDNQFILTKM